MNLKTLSFQKKFKALWIGAAVLLVISWTLSFSKTVDLFSENARLEKNLIRANTAPQEVGKLKKQLNVFTNKLEQYTADSITHQQEVMEVVSEFCQKNRLMLRNIPVRYYSSEKDFQIETMEIVIEGSYHGLLKLLYELEIKQKKGRITSAHFYNYKDPIRKKNALQLKLFLQTIQLKKQP
jgi:hypothetical protein